MRQSLFSSRALASLFFAAFTFAGCRCDGTLRENYGELVIIWRDANAEVHRDRDATVDFGVGIVGDSKATLTNGLPAVITVRNAGSNRLTLTSLEVVEGDEVAFGAPPEGTATTHFELEFESITLEPTAQRELKLAFTPKTTRNNFESKLKLTTEGTHPDASEASITLLGQGDLSACDLPNEINFGKVLQGETLTATVTFQNPTRIEATGSTGPITGIGQANFGYKAPSAAGDVVVEAQSSTDVVFTFTPDELQEYTASVVVRGAGECPEQTITLRGVGSDERLTWAPEVIDYGYVNPGEDVLREVTFINPASVPITLTAVTSSNLNDFRVVPDVAGEPTDTFTVPGDSVPTTLKIACNPSELGARLGVVTFNTGLVQTPTGTITLRCTGGGPRIRITPSPTLNFGLVGYFPAAVPAYTVQRKLKIQNVGVVPNPPDPTANLYLDKDNNPGPGLFGLSGPNAAEFTVGLNSTPAYDSVNGIPANPGLNFVDLNITLTPASTGQKSATLTVYSTDPQEDVLSIELLADAQAPPPCTLEVVPSPMLGLNFGLMGAGEVSDLPVRVTNVGAANEVCHITGVELAAGSAADFSIISAHAPTVTLQPQEFMEIMVRMAPIGALPAQLETRVGKLAFNTTSAAALRVEVNLTGAVGPACITISPDPMDFGTVAIGCFSATRQFSIYNSCGGPIQINSISMQTPSLVPQGQDGCATVGGCPEFSLVGSPSVTLPAGMAANAPPITFQARYRPYNLGDDVGTIDLEALQNGQTVHYVITLRGKGSVDGAQVDTYTQDLQPKADVLLVVDDSCSMDDKQTRLANNFTSFIQYANMANVDYRIGVTTTTLDETECVPFFGCIGNNSVGLNGSLVVDGPTQLKWVTPQTTQVEQVFSRLVRVGTNGAGSEKPLAAATIALTPPVVQQQNAGFLREEANLAVVVVTDASDQSAGSPNSYLDQLINIKGYHRLSYFTFSAVSPRLPAAPSGCTYDTESANSTRFNPLTQATAGVEAEICNSNGATTLQGLGQVAFGYRTHFYLANQPGGGASTITVRVNGAVVPQCPAAGQCWTFEAPQGIKFMQPPSPGQELTFEYTQQCFQ